MPSIAPKVPWIIISNKRWAVKKVVVKAPETTKLKGARIKLAMMKAKVVIIPQIAPAMMPTRIILPVMILLFIFQSLCRFSIKSS